MWQIRCSTAYILRLLLRTGLMFACLIVSACTDKNQHVVPRQSTDSRLLDLAQHDTRGGFARALEGRTFRFPEDHGTHPRFKQERWQFNGNLQSSDGRQFAYQFTLQRLGLMNDVVSMLNQQGNTTKQSQWRSNHLYLASFSLSDASNKKFYQFEKTERGSLGLAGVSLKQDNHGGPKRLAMNIDNWTVNSSVTGVFPLHLSLDQQGISLNIEMSPARDAHPNGNDGVRQQGEDTGNASYSYSITRLNTSGRVNVAGQQFTIQGQSWFDHDWGTAPLGNEIKGIDHYMLQLSDGLDLAFYRLRNAEQNQVSWSRGIMVFSNGRSEDIQSGDIELQATRQWTSPETGILYPISWNITLPKYHMSLFVTPLLANQEIRQGQTRWEGAVRVAGYQNSETASKQTVTGYGYLQLKGYH